MKFEFNFGYAITAFTAVLFYFRIAMLRGKKRRLTKQEMTDIMKMPKSKKRTERMTALENRKTKPAIEVTSWLLVIVAIVLMLAGVIFKNTTSLNIPAMLTEYWWVGPSLGFIVFMFSFK
jgi:hypothetical protein